LTIQQIYTTAWHYGFFFLSFSSKLWKFIVFNDQHYP